MLIVRARSAVGNLELLEDTNHKPSRWYVAEGGIIIGRPKSRREAFAEYSALVELALQDQIKCTSEVEAALRKDIRRWEDESGPDEGLGLRPEF